MEPSTNKSLNEHFETITDMFKTVLYNFGLISESLVIGKMKHLYHASYGKPYPLDNSFVELFLFWNMCPWETLASLYTKLNLPQNGLMSDIFKGINKISDVFTGIPAIKRLDVDEWEKYLKDTLENTYFMISDSYLETINQMSSLDELMEEFQFDIKFTSDKIKDSWRLYELLGEMVTNNSLERIKLTNFNKFDWDLILQYVEPEQNEN